MSKHPVVATGRPVHNVERNAVEIVEPAPRPSPFFSFSYSFTEVSTVGGKTQVKSRKTRFEGGKLVSESFEGETDGGAYERAVRQATDQVLEQVRLLMQPLMWFLPAGRKDSDRG